MLSSSTGIEPSGHHRGGIEAEHRACIEPQHRATASSQHRAFGASSIVHRGRGSASMVTYDQAEHCPTRLYEPGLIARLFGDGPKGRTRLRRSDYCVNERSYYVYRCHLSLKTFINTIDASSSTLIANIEMYDFIHHSVAHTTVVTTYT